MKSQFRDIILKSFLILVVHSFIILPSSNIDFQAEATQSTGCILYDSGEKAIMVSCKTANLSEIYSALHNDNILRKEKNSTWVLNSNVIIKEGSTLYINSTDTSWLKMVTQNDTAYGIIVYGSLKIHSVKITSWDPKLNDYIKFKVQVRPNSEDNLGHDEIPRPYIRIEQEATGTTDVIDSEIAYMGYKCDTGDGGGCAGLNFYGGHGSIVKNNHIHNNRFGFYSDGVGNMILENNHVHHNYMYGFDPHTGTHDMIIRNNTIHNNGGIGIICSLDCYKITIEGNHVYENIDAGIMFSRNMTNSIAINNIGYNETQCIFISQSHNNKIYNNTVSHCENGIYLKNKSSNNVVSNNSISDSKRGIYLNSGAKNNIFNQNQITNVEEKFLDLKH